MNRTLERALRLAELISCALMGAMVLFIALAILGRWFGILFASAEELATFAMVGMAFLGMPVAYVRGAHVRIGTITNRVGDGPRRVCLGLSLGVALLVVLTLAYYTSSMAYDAFRFGDRSIGLSNTPLWIPQTALPVGLLLLATTLLVDLAEVLCGNVSRARQPADDPAMIE